MSLAEQYKAYRDLCNKGFAGSSAVEQSPPVTLEQQKASVGSSPASQPQTDYTIFALNSLMYKPMGESTDSHATDWDNDTLFLPWPSVESAPLVYKSTPPTKYFVCEDCKGADGTCDPILTDNKHHWVCEMCCEIRRQTKNWQPKKTVA